jgi:hypothetical protein
VDAGHWRALDDAGARRWASSIAEDLGVRLTAQLFASSLGLSYRRGQQPLHRVGARRAGLLSQPFRSTVDSKLTASTERYGAGPAPRTIPRSA